MSYEFFLDKFEIDIIKLNKDKFILHMTPEQVKRIFSEHGMSVRDFARKHGFSDSLVYAVLAGKNKATRGESHRIAVALGLKPAPTANEVPGLFGEPCPPAETTHLHRLEAPMT